MKSFAIRAFRIAALMIAVLAVAGCVAKRSADDANQSDSAVAVASAQPSYMSIPF